MLLLTELTHTTESFAPHDEEGAGWRRRPLGSLARHVMLGAFERSRFNADGAFARLHTWCESMSPRLALVCRMNAADIRHGLTALNGELWEVVAPRPVRRAVFVRKKLGRRIPRAVVLRSAGELHWNDAYDEDDLDQGPTRFFADPIIRRAIGGIDYAPPRLIAVRASARGSGKEQRRLRMIGRRMRLTGGPLSAVLVSTIEALWLRQLGICPACRALFLAGAKDAARKHCPECSKDRRRQKKSGVEKDYRAALMRLSRRRMSDDERSRRVEQCREIRRQVRRRTLSTKEARASFEEVAKPATLGRPPKTPDESGR